eukprot:TRINITY_DN3102_c1_g2_i1.p1 TRINITY_DN3102_c1_g2~~TRINITY_DN3102_c1_g2_i1.p1  ORF type:complete len:184 (+),score=52.55 TRINITY_DN3102_c1_g2_i1:61-612(+)
MSVVIETDWRRDELLPVDPTRSLRHLAASLCHAAQLACPPEALMFEVGGHVLEGSEAVSEYGIQGAEERVRVTVRAEYVLRAQLARAGVTRQNQGDVFADAAAANNRALVRRMLAAGLLTYEEVVRAVMMAAAGDTLNVFDGAELPDGAREDAVRRREAEREQVSAQDEAYDVAMAMAEVAWW